MDLFGLKELRSEGRQMSIEAWLTLGIIAIIQVPTPDCDGSH